MKKIMIAFLSLSLAYGLAMAQKYNEAPMLAELVKQGKLPPVEQRLPKEPRVEVVPEIGTYGGTYMSGGLGATNGQLDAEGLRFTTVVTREPDRNTLTPMVIKDYKVNADLSVYTLYLREGMKWHNGDPLTTDDFMFWYEDILLNKELTPDVPDTHWIRSSTGKILKWEKISDYELRISSDAPYATFDLTMAGWSGMSRGKLRSFFAPQKYLKKWHIKYNKDANKQAKDEGFENWVLAFTSHAEMTQGTVDKDSPTLQPWVLTEVKNNGNRVFTRNPYYHVVDQNGNQLPYVDKQEVVILDGELRALQLTAGELHASAEYGSMMIKDYTLYKENEKKGDYKTLRFGNTRGVDTAFAFNLTSKDETLRKIFNNIKFRQAMSLALDRDALNEVNYKGQSVIRQATAARGTSFLDESVENYMIEYDVDQANGLLDQVGLQWNSSKTVRLRPDGKPLEIVIESIESHAKVSEMTAEYWRAVGINAQVKLVERALYLQRVGANEIDVNTWTLDGMAESSLRTNKCGRLRPSGSTDHLDPWPEYRHWFNSNGARGIEPPQDIKELDADCIQFGDLTPSDPKYASLGRSILERSVKGLWYISAPGVSPRIVVMNNKLGNAPLEGFYAADYLFWQPYKGWTWFLRK